MKMKSEGLIVLDGPDCSGKSYLAEYLAENYNATIFHQGYDKSWDIFKYHTECLMEALKLSERKLVVMDRLWISECVYASVFRGGTRWPHAGRIIDRVLLKHAALNVVCLGDEKVIVARHAAMKNMRTEMFDSNMAAVVRRYQAIFDGNQPWPSYCDYAEFLSTSARPYSQRHDVLRYSIEDQGQDIQGFAERALEKLAVNRAVQFSPALNFSYQNFLGYLPTAKVAMVGDVPNAKYPVRWPFYEHGNCSFTLAEALNIAKIDETSLVWMNANEPNCPIKLIASKPGLKVIALGREAAKTLDSLQVSHLDFTHPQHVRRFGNNVLEYAANLQKAIV